VTVDGVRAGPSFINVRPGAVVRAGDRAFRLSPPAP
jgi:hypothetical protein